MKVPCLALAVALLAPVASALDDDSSTVEVAILDVLLERGIIDPATYEELLGLAQAERAERRELDLLEQRMRRLSAPPPEIRATGGAPGEFLVESTDGRWSLGFQGRVQVQADVVQGEGGNSEANASNIAVRRGRLAVFGRAGDEETTYRFEIDAPTQSKVDEGKEDVEITDAWLDWGLGDGTHVRAGQFRVPFGREINIGNIAATTAEFSAATTAFAPDREPGVMLHGATRDRFLEYQAGVFNGEGTGMANASGEEGSSSTGMRWAARVVVNPLGAVEPDLAPFQTVYDGSTRLALGASVMVNTDQGQDLDGDGTDETRSEDSSVGVEAQVVTGPMSVLAEYFRREMDIEGAGRAHDDGYNAQVGFQVVPQRYEVVLRRSDVDLERADDMTETTLAVVRYVDEHKSKLILDVSKLENGNVRDGDEMRYRGQYQIIF